MNDYHVRVRTMDKKIVFEGVGLSEDHVMELIRMYNHYPDFTVENRPDSEPEKKEERYQAYEDLAFNTNRDELAKSCAEFLMSYCDQYPLCTNCVFRRNKSSKEIYCALGIYPKNWELKEGDTE